MRLRNVLFLTFFGLNLMRRPAAARTSKQPEQKVVFFDDFESDTLDFKKWEHEVTAWGGGVSGLIFLPACHY